MSRQKQAGTLPELTVRAMVREAGGHYRVSNRDLPGSPDIANRSRKWAIFVHGCFWHAHVGCGQAVLPKRNRAVWRKKFAGNRQRDALKEAALRERGYRVLVVWECELNRVAYLRNRLHRLIAQLGDVGRGRASASRTEMRTAGTSSESCSRS